MDNHQPLGGLAFPEGVVHALRFSRNGELLLAAVGKRAGLGRVVLFDVRSGKRLAEIGEESDSVIVTVISPDLSLVALGGPDKLVKVVSVATGKQLYQIKKHTDWLTAIEFSPDGNYLLSLARNGDFGGLQTDTNASLCQSRWPASDDRRLNPHDSCMGHQRKEAACRVFDKRRVFRKRRSDFLARPIANGLNAAFLSICLYCMIPPSFRNYWLIRLPNSKSEGPIEDITANVAYPQVISV